MNHKVLWHEGMFLMPQHFQQNDRYFETYIKNYWELLYPNAVGIINFQIDLASLEQGDVYVKECSAILPDYTVVDIPNKQPAPLRLSLDKDTDEEIIFIGLAKPQADLIESSNNTTNQKPMKYIVDEIDIKDTHYITGSSITTAKVLTGALAIKLLIASEIKNHIAIPLLKVKKDIITNKFIIINEYIPPCINAYSSAYLSHELFLLAKLVNYRVASTTTRIKENNLTQSDKLLEIQYLRILINFSSWITAVNFHKYLHPHELYLFLFSFARELALFSDLENLQNINFNVTNDLFSCFAIIINKIKEYLSHTTNPKLITIKGENLEKGLWKLINIQSELKFEADFYLAISIKDLTEKNNFSFQQHLKIAPIEEIKNLVYRSLPGIHVDLVSKLPREIPFHENFLYFQINQDNELWNKLESSAGLGVYISGKFELSHLQLWIVKKS